MTRVAELRARLEAALAKPFAEPGEGPSVDEFDPWEDVIQGVHGSYSGETDRLFIAALIAVRDRATFEFIDAEGFAGELTLYILSGHGFLEYGTSPRGGWWDADLGETLQPLIDKWTEYAALVWSPAT